jgi:RNA polymerase sigma factor (sigma-70 family)
MEHRSINSTRATAPDSAGWLAREVEPHRPALKSWLKARFPWLSDVDNVVQEAVFRLWKRNARANLPPVQCPKAALYTIARNAVIDEARRDAAVPIKHVADLTDLSVLDNMDVAAIVSARQELEFLADALRELPARCRQVVTLTKIHGHTEREVAEQLGISESTVRTHVVRGMEHCADYLRRHGVNRSRL